VVNAIVRAMWERKREDGGGSCLPVTRHRACDSLITLSGIEALVPWCSPASRGLATELAASERQQGSSGKGWFPASLRRAEESLARTVR